MAASRATPRRRTTARRPDEFRISESTLERSRSKPRQKFEPFVAPSHPPSAVPPAEKTIAQDEAITENFNWANAAIGSAYAEGQTWLGYPELSLMAQRAEYRVISEEIASEMTREWIELKATGEDSKKDKIKLITDELDNLNVRRVLQKGALHDGFFGRGPIYLDIGDTDDDEELRKSIGDGRNLLSKAKVNKKHPLRGVRNVEPIWVYPTQYNSTDPLKEDWYRPERWFVMGKEVHRSRLLTLVGREVPDLLKPVYSFGGLSMSQMVKPYVDNWLRTRQSVSDLIHSFTVWCLWTNMGAIDLGLGGEQFWRRVELFNNLRDNRGCFVLNKGGAGKEEEDFKNISAPLGTLDKLQAQAQEQMASVARIPIVKLLGIQPAGLNASSEGELRSFYDWIAAFQEALFRDPLTTIIDFIQLSLFNEVDDEITFDFNPLYQLDEGQQSEVDLKKAQTDDAYMQMGAVSAEEIRERLAGDPKSPYQGLDLKDRPMPPPPAPPMPGEGTPGAHTEAEGQKSPSGEELDRYPTFCTRLRFSSSRPTWGLLI